MKCLNCGCEIEEKKETGGVRAHWRHLGPGMIYCAPFSDLRATPARSED